MERFDRIFRLHRILRSHRHPVPRRKLEEALECSRATVKRIIEDMRDNLNAPIVYDRDVNDAVDAMIQMIEPALTVILGGMMLWIAAAVFGPIYNSFGAMG